MTFQDKELLSRVADLRSQRRQLPLSKPEQTGLKQDLLLCQNKPLLTELLSVKPAPNGTPQRLTEQGDVQNAVALPMSNSVSQE